MTRPPPLRLPTFNHAHYIGEALRSVFVQNVDGLEIMSLTMAPPTTPSGLALDATAWACPYGVGAVSGHRGKTSVILEKDGIPLAGLHPFAEKAYRLAMTACGDHRLGRRRGRLRTPVTAYPTAFPSCSSLSPQFPPCAESYTVLRPQ